MGASKSAVQYAIKKLQATGVVKTAPARSNVYSLDMETPPQSDASARD